MYDPVPAPPRRTPTGAGVVVLRVVLPLVPVVSIGLLSCVPLFRAAFVRGRWYDWLVAWLSIPLAVLGFGLTAALPEDAAGSDVGVGLLLLVVLLSITYFLVVDIRQGGRRDRRFEAGRAAAMRARGTGPGYGYPGPGYGYPGPGAYPGPHGAVAPPPHQQGPAGPVPAPPVHPAGGRPAANDQGAPDHPAPPKPGSSRVDQVRAELDELSDILRKKQDDW